MGRFHVVFGKRRAVSDPIEGRWGEWTQLVRAVACYDYGAAERVLDWPLEEALYAYWFAVRREALEAFRHEQKTWALTAPHTTKQIEQPRLPAILREREPGP